ncbi:phosphatidylserine decarboxylase [Catenovulum sp. SM1970]|uniref:archaetidylserine decarboxylase n=1 Tax=Marinifaba aquimaris TaxID=2741323 RepID=UPI001572ED6F|nr:archaetidylserine decarboxylase [Marinifaba aquimaris]NTS76876.1 phosphatidylserine decarboxylase [Marinifaba aquimaris]
MLQYCFPQHGLSRLVGLLAASKNKTISQAFIRIFANRFGISLEEANKSEFKDFASFNEFFTRTLKPGARPVDTAEDAFVCPVDGAVSQQGNVVNDLIVQAKGHDYSVTALLGGDEQLAKPYEGGKFTTIYLSPKDYHRIHMPVTGKLKRMTYVPGKLFSVNPATTRNVPGLFARNERVICTFDTDFGEMSMVLVGATIVASIETVWAGTITPPTGARPFTWHYKDEQAITLEKGEEMGLFKLGSTVILLMPQDTIDFEDDFEEEAVVRLGRKVATIK